MNGGNLRPPTGTSADTGREFGAEEVDPGCQVIDRSHSRSFMKSGSLNLTQMGPGPENLNPTQISPGSLSKA